MTTPPPSCPPCQRQPVPRPAPSVATLLGAVIDRSGLSIPLVARASGVPENDLYTLLCLNDQPLDDLALGAVCRVAKVDPLPLLEAAALERVWWATEGESIEQERARREEAASAQRYECFPEGEHPSTKVLQRLQEVFEAVAKQSELRPKRTFERFMPAMYFVVDNSSQVTLVWSGNGQKVKLEVLAEGYTWEGGATFDAPLGPLTKALPRGFLDAVTGLFP